ncbi:MAG: Hpt domain-containing protein [Gammaproteobacteria bacterium]|nr:Hpt domain-containing protein [Gammaproteobacteria bacterium]MBI5617077.1 Hpt domain-containing protein [Gammaproteobacteria bacterium]
MIAQTDMDALRIVAPEIDRVLALTASALTDGANAELARQCERDLHRLRGAFEMAAAPGLARFCECFTAGYCASLADPANRSRWNALLERALAALKRCVRDAEHNGAVQSMLLFPLYVDMKRALGEDKVSASDLYYPEVDVERSRGEPVTLPAQDSTAVAKLARGRYQRALLAWLRGDGVAPAAMLRAVTTVDQLFGAQSNFWWVACGFLDGIRAGGFTIDSHLKRICARIDLQIARICDGANLVSDALLREMLYFIGRCTVDTTRISELREAYALDDDARNGAAESDDPAARAAALSAVHTAQRTLEGLAGGGAGAEAAFDAAIERLNACIDTLREPAVKAAGNAVGTEAQELRSGGRNYEKDAVSLAGLLLALERVLDERTAQPGATAELNALLEGGTTTGGTTNRLDAALGQEIRKSLKQVEHALESLTAAAVPRDVAPALNPLRRAGAALAIASQTEAAQLLAHAEGLVRELADSPTPETQIETLAECLGGAELFVEAACRGSNGREVILPLLRKLGLAPADEPPGEPAATQPATVEQALALERRGVQDLLHNWQRSSERVVDELKNNLQAIHQDALLVADREVRERSAHALSLLQAAPPAIDPQLRDAVAAVGGVMGGRGQAPAAVDVASDPEVLDVYLEEAREVLDTVRAHLASDARTPEGLREVRRYYHTLKGSSRVVGLVHMGEVAWSVERQLNAWLDADLDATPALLAAVGAVAEAFAGWVENLADHGSTGVDAAALQAGIDALTPASATAPEPVPAAQADVEPEPPAAGAAPNPDHVRLGPEFTVSRALLDIFRSEAAQHLATLRTDADSAAPGDTVRRTALRAAHTLAGIGRTVRIDAVAGLAAALEAWLERMLDAGAAMEEECRALFVEAVDSLGAMLATIEGEALPIADTALRDKLEAAAAAVVAAEEAAFVEQEIAIPAALLEAAFMQGVNPEILPVVLDEAHDLGAAIGRELVGWRESPDEEAHGEAVVRHLHTLKGSVRAAGAMQLGDFAHASEARIQTMLLNETADPEWLEALQQWFDTWLIAIDALKSARAGQLGGAAQRSVAEGQRPAPRATGQLRVATETVEHLIEASSELGLTRARTANEVDGIGQGVADLKESIVRLRQQIREVEIQAESQMSARQTQIEEDNAAYDPLEFDRFTRLQELTRQMAESLHDVVTVQQNLQRHLDDVEEVLERQGSLSRDMHGALMRIYAVPFGTVTERLERVVRQATSALDKAVRLHVRGAEVELDRGILDRIVGPLEHLLRNSIAHGIEAGAERLAAGKPAAGRLDVVVRQDANRVTIEVSDDGRGLDLARIRAKAETAGIVAPGAELTEQQLRALIFAPGLSTAESVTEVSGRGIGMDAVRNAVQTLGGTIDIRTEAGRGTTFLVHLPLTVVVVSVVTVMVGGRQFAIPANLVRQAQRMNGTALRELYARGESAWQDERYPFHHLSELIGKRVAPTVNERGNMVLYLGADERRVAIHVDSLSVTQDVTLKDMGPQLGRVPALAGASVTGAGRVLLVIDPLQMVSRVAAAKREDDKTKGAARRQPLVLIVDDSITVRKVTSRLMERAGYRVATAKDGVEGLEQMHAKRPDIVLLDIEMPRMDGFEFTKHVRSEAATAALPIVIISSRTADKHRQHAERLGVNLFLGKPYEDDRLLAAVASLVGGEGTDALPRTGT